MRSIRARLTAVLLAGLAATLVAAAAVLHGVATAALRERFDEGLVAKARVLATLLESDDGRVEFEFAPEAMPEYRSGPEAEYFSVTWSDGTPFASSPSLGDASLASGRAGAAPASRGPVSSRPAHGSPPDAAAESAGGAPAAPRVDDLVLPDGRPGRAASLVVRALPDDEATDVDRSELPLLRVVTARSRAPLDAGREALMAGLAAAALLGLLGVGFVVAWSVRHGLRPLASLGDELGALGADTLDRRLGTGEGPAELVPIRARLDELIARLEAAFARQRRMTAAIAHELRTPVAELRAAADVARAWPDDAELQVRAVATAQDVAVTMSAIVEAVLHLGRIEAGREGPAAGEVSLDRIVDGAWEGLSTLATSRGVVCERDLDVEVATDGDLLALVLRNLLENAVRFAPEGGRVTIGARVEGEATVLRVENVASGLAPGDLPHLDEPFWQGDAARSEPGHSGLGLALAQAAAAALGTTIAFDLAGDVLAATLRLPRPPAVGPASASPAPDPRP